MPNNFDALFTANINAIRAMDFAAGSMVKQLIMTLAKQTPPTYIKLSDGLGHEIDFGVVEGSLEAVERIGRKLGLVVAEGMIRVPGR